MLATALFSLRLCIASRPNSIPGECDAGILKSCSMGSSFPGLSARLSEEGASHEGVDLLHLGPHLDIMTLFKPCYDKV
jgi:hypothetical protein